MKLDLQNHVALVCGGSRGIGKAAALSLAGEGAVPVLLSRSEAHLAEARDEISQLTGITCESICGDVADPELPARAVREVIKRYGRIDILVNNSGGPAVGSFLEHEEEKWASAVQMNLMSVVRFSKAAAAEMKARRYGRIVNVTSFLAKEPTAPMVISGTLRAGVSAFAKAISHELVEHGVTVNTICPSAVLTDRARELAAITAGSKGISLEEVLQQAEAGLPIRRFAEPSELADIITFFCSPGAAYLTGVSLMVDGGLSKSVF